MWSLVSQKEIMKQNDSIDYSKPVIGFCPDWRQQIDEQGNVDFLYMSELCNSMKRFIELKGA